MKRPLWQQALCGLIFAFSFGSALAQKADYAAAARAASPEAEVDTYVPRIDKGLVDKRRDEVLALIPQADRPSFLASVPKDRDDAYSYYGIVKACTGKGWKNCMPK